MNLIRRELIKAYFEATWYEEEYGLDYTSRNLILGLDKYLKSNEEYDTVTLSGNTAYFQCEDNFQPPLGIIVSGKVMKNDADLEVSIETDKFCNITNVFWDAV